MDTESAPSQMDSDEIYRHQYRGREYVFQYRDGPLGETLKLVGLGNGVEISQENFPHKLRKMLKKQGYRVVV